MRIHWPRRSRAGARRAPPSDTSTRLHFGPIADLGLSERIDVAPARDGDIDAILKAATPIDASTVSKAGGHSKGFLGLEYLLFSADGADAALAPFVTNDDAASRRAALTHAMADEVAATAHQLRDAWTDKDGYAHEIDDAGKSSERYPTQRAALDDIVGGVGYALEIVVGVRLAQPLGHKSSGGPDPSLDPTPASDSAAADMQASLEGVRALYDGDGFSARVHSKSAVLDDRMTSQLDACAAKVGAIPTPFSTALTADTATVEAAFDACKTAKGTWNTSVVGALGATLKPGDVDGD